MSVPAAPPGFLDAASGQPLNPAARQAWEAAADAGWADPRRLYREGRRAALLAEAAQEAVAARIGARPDEVSLVADGVLPDVIRALLSGSHPSGTGGPRLVCSAVDHSSVLAEADGLIARGGTATVIGVDRFARIDLDALTRAITPGTSLAVLQAANHEVGTRQPIPEAAAACAAAGVPLLVDATMTLGREDPPEGWSIVVGRALTWGGPPGVAVVAVRRSLHAPPLALPSAGLPAAIAAARGLEWADAHRADDAQSAREFTDRIRRGVSAGIPDIALLGSDDRVAYLTAFSCLFVDGEALVHALDRQGYAISSGSSCVSDLRRPSHVLAAMGALTQGNVRISLPFGATEETIEGFITACATAVRDVRGTMGAEGL